MSMIQNSIGAAKRAAVLQTIACSPVDKNTHTQVVSVYTDIFNSSLIQKTVPLSFKYCVIVPVPENSNASTLNDFNPMALTSVEIKWLEKLMLQSSTIQSLELIVNLGAPTPTCDWIFPYRQITDSENGKQSLF